MGKKKVSGALPKTCKKEKQLHSLMNVLRPKVYITDSTSFKQLVQELTGYRQSRITDIPEEVETVPVMENIEIAAPSITATSLDSSSCTQTFQLEEINQESGPMQTADQHMSMFYHEPLSVSQGHTDWSAYQNIESWLFDTDDHEPYSWYTGSSLIEQETSLSDYELLY
ncbi:hypothetical protein HRI_001296800 [Hibiscus trionum]|uniref:VQ domain-containing protein n=1 Tax=Hibiscus trionum TaxID=183268 RepID=A0A9W7HEQ1_HIBTR|nr:hypothetical protein HRI_001296800 [Hibiscus trionum]